MREYFPHDYHARHDPKLLNLMKNEGLEGLAIFWCVVEIMYEQSGVVMRSQCDGIAYSLHTSSDKVFAVFEKYDLFILDGEQYTSPSINRRLDERKVKSEKAKSSSMARWTQCDRNATAMRPESESILLNKRKEKITPIDPAVQGVVSKPLTPIQEVVEHYKALKGYDRDAEWDKTYYPRHTKSAKAILTYCKDDVDQSKKRIDFTKRIMREKKLDWTLETVVKRMADYKGENQW